VFQVSRDEDINDERLAGIDPETIAFLKRLRKDEVSLLEDVIRTISAFYRVGRMGRWFAVALILAFLTFVDVWAGAKQIGEWLAR
jgi:hypothetical protein